MANPFYPGQTDYLERLNAMYSYATLALLGY